MYAKKETKRQGDGHTTSMSIWDQKERQAAEHEKNRASAASALAVVARLSSLRTSTSSKRRTDTSNNAEFVKRRAQLQHSKAVKKHKEKAAVFEKQTSARLRRKQLETLLKEEQLIEAERQSATNGVREGDENVVQDVDLETEEYEDLLEERDVNQGIGESTFEKESLVASNFQFSIPLQPQQKPVPIAKRVELAAKTEYAVRYLEQIGATPTPENIRLVDKRMGIEHECNTTAAWRSRGWISDCLFVIPKWAAASSKGRSDEQSRRTQKAPSTLKALARFTMNTNRARNWGKQRTVQMRNSNQWTFQDVKRMFGEPGGWKPSKVLPYQPGHERKKGFATMDPRHSTLPVHMRRPLRPNLLRVLSPGGAALQRVVKEIQTALDVTPTEIAVLQKQFLDTVPTATDTQHDTARCRSSKLQRQSQEDERRSLIRKLVLSDKAIRLVGLLAHFLYWQVLQRWFLEIKRALVIECAKKQPKVETAPPPSSSFGNPHGKRMTRNPKRAIKTKGLWGDAIDKTSDINQVTLHRLGAAEQEALYIAILSAFQHLRDEAGKLPIFAIVVLSLRFSACAIISQALPQTLDCFAMYYNFDSNSKAKLVSGNRILHPLPPVAPIDCAILDLIDPDRFLSNVPFIKPSTGFGSNKLVPVKRNPEASAKGRQLHIDKREKSIKHESLVTGKLIRARSPGYYRHTSPIVSSVVEGATTYSDCNDQVHTGTEKHETAAQSHRFAAGLMEMPFSPKGLSQLCRAALMKVDDKA